FKAVMKTPKKMKELKPDKIVKEYLDAVYAKKASESASIKAKDAPVVAKMKEIKIEWKKFLNKDREEYLKSDEYKSWLASLSDSGDGSDDSEVTIKNTGSKVICISHSGGAESLYPGSSTSFFCNKDIFYGVDHGSGCRGDKSRLIIGANKGCGQTIEVQ
ncbi:MAG: hypothetical protein AAF740_12025, partial [Bacteroidota bacterium]